jgi:transcriptional regulator with XRE-family HTH domain
MQNRITGAGRDGGIYREGSPRRFQGQWNLDDVLRDVLRGLMRDREWSQAELSRRIGQPRSQVSRFLGGLTDDDGRERDFNVRLEFLSAVCAALDETPLELFSRHPVFQLEANDLRRHRMHAKLVELLIPAEANALLVSIEQAKQRGVLDLVLAQVDTLLEAAKRSESTGRTRLRSG